MPGGGNDNVGNDNTAPLIFPANYRDTFRLVRDCRTSIEHQATIRVYVNEVGAEAYLSDAAALPIGTIVVKEEFSGVACDDDGELAFWSAMLKREAGFDTEDGDWQWQEAASPERRVTLDDKTTCIRCHRVPDCLERDYMCTVP